MSRVRHVQDQRSALCSTIIPCGLIEVLRDLEPSTRQKIDRKEVHEMIAKQASRESRVKGKGDLSAPLPSWVVYDQLLAT